MSDYKINHTPGADADICQGCQHSRAAHGSNGHICCRCGCTLYVEKPEPPALPSAR